MAYRRITDDEPRVSRRALLGLAALASAAPLLAGCGGATPPALLMAAGVKRVPPPPDAPVADATAGMLAFGRKLIAASATDGGNWIASPLSMAVCFAMARVGAAGTTASQLDEVFGFPAQGRDDAFNAITREIVTTDGPPGQLSDWHGVGPQPVPIVSLGNALFTSKDLPLGAAFLRTLAAQYGTGARPVDFASGHAADDINKWVERATAGRIKKVFDQLDPTTRLVLANAVYFRAYWSLPFEGSAPGRFTRADGTTVNPTMLSQIGKYNYASVNGTQALDLAYAGGPDKMRLLLPAPGGKPADVLDPAVITALSRAMKEQRVNFAMPKFDFETDIDLGPVLADLGLTALFGAAADFSGISRGLFVSQAVHRANIAVDEWGTTAAGATGVGFGFSAPAVPPLSFIADRPFALMILGGADEVPLFVGQVNDPTAK